MPAPETRRTSQWPGYSGENGAHERLHKILKADVTNELVTFLGSMVPREQVLAYFDAGHVVTSSLGWSTCRCCGISGSEMGDSDLTDGTWVWPEGLSHYLRMHGVPLPEEFSPSMNRNQFVVPAIRAASLLEVPLPHDCEFWHQWTDSVYRTSRR